MDSKNHMKQKVMVLYVLPGQPACENIIRMAQPYGEILIQDIRSGKPEWLRGVPTAASLRSNNVYTGSRAIEFVKYYINAQQVQSGPQRDIVLQTSPGYSAEDQPQLHDGPVGYGSTANAAEIDIQGESDWLYERQSITDKDITAYIQRRNNPKKKQTKLIPSNLEDGSYVTM